MIFTVEECFVVKRPQRRALAIKTISSREVSVPKHDGVFGLKSDDEVFAIRPQGHKSPRLVCR